MKRRAPANSTAMVTVRLIWPFLELARKAGHADAENATARLLGMSIEQLRNPEAMVSLQLVGSLLDAAIRVGGDRDIGLRAAKLVDSAQVGLTEYVARSQPTLRDAIESTARYLGLFGDAAQQHFEVNGKVASITYMLDAEVVLHEAAYEFTVALGILRARRITGLPDLAPIEVHFTHPEPADITRHKKLFRCALRFGMPATKILMSSEYIRMRLATAEPALNELLAKQADAQLASLPRTRTVAGRVRVLLNAQHNLRDASADRIAKRLGMSVRTLARKLDTEATSYRELFDDARKRLSLNALARTTRPIAALADDLGFASTQGFHRAFRRWTGTSAATYRANARRKR